MVTLLRNLRAILTKRQWDTTDSSAFKLTKRQKYLLGLAADLVLILIIIMNGIQPAQRLITPLITPLTPLTPLTEDKGGYEVFGFAPHWTFQKLDNVDFDVLTTFAYFGVPIDGDGNLVRADKGYEVFKSDKATAVFKKAHSSGTRVVLTVTQMKNEPILALMDNPNAQNNAITQIVSEVKDRGIDGINVDMEFTGNPGVEYRQKFSLFVKNLTERMHQEIPNSKVTVSVYASAVKSPKIYDIKELAENSDGIFMMAYDFAVASSDNAIPTAPLYGYKNGKYWYDISTAVDDFLTLMPADKLILGVPYYGYNYMVYEPTVKGETRPSPSWRGQARAETYTNAISKLTAEGITEYKTGWDENGQVGYIAYYVAESGTWRMMFLDDVRSLGIKYDFAKEKSLAGVGMWALGFDDGKTELWTLLEEKFGTKQYADQSILRKEIK